MADRHIGAEHLLFGLPREQCCCAAEILSQHGLDVDQLRTKFGKPSPLIFPWSAWGKSVCGARVERDRLNSFLAQQDTVEIDGELWDADYLRDAVEKCRRCYSNNRKLVSARHRGPARDGSHFI